MKQNDTKRSTGCPVAFGLDTFGDRWSLLIIRDIMIKGQKTYSEFLESGEKIASNILVDRLKHLEAEGIVKKQRDPDNRRSFLYTLTPKGLDLAPIMIELILWSAKHDDRPFALRDTIKEIQKDQPQFEKRLRRG